ncbi:hypothetical protein ScPMuIL_006847 [Solemya velum]
MYNVMNRRADIMLRIQTEVIFIDRSKHAYYSLTVNCNEVFKHISSNMYNFDIRYLDLLKDKVQYPCLLDADGHVISFPPITNSDKTKITKDTADIFVEVTSSSGLDVCKTVMEELLVRMLEMGIGDFEEEEQNEAGDAATCDVSSPHKLLVEQVKIVDHQGSMRVIYPSRTDLTTESISVTRNYD